MFPEQLYVPTPYDFVVGTAPRRYMERVNSTPTAVSAPLAFAIVPMNEVLFIEHLMISMGAFVATAEVIQEIFCQVRQDQGAGVSNEVSLAFMRSNRTAGGLGQDVSFTSPVNLWLMPSEFLQFNFLKSAAVSTFSFQVAAHGWRLPRATIQSG